MIGKCIHGELNVSDPICLNCSRLLLFSALTDGGGNWEGTLTFPRVHA